MNHIFSTLVVEPEVKQQDLIEEVLRSEFKITDIAISPTSIEAMSVLNKQGNIQCIIISSNLEDSNGFSLIEDIRAIEKYSNTPVLIMSDIQERDHLIKAAASGATDFIVKPFNSRSLTLKLKKLLADKQHRKATRISTLEDFDVEIIFDTDIVYNCKLIDISTDGCSTTSPPFDKGGTVFQQAVININNNGTLLAITAELARTERDLESEDRDKKKQISGFQFTALDNETFNAILDFISTWSARYRSI